MGGDISYCEALYKTLKDEKEGLTYKEIYKRIRHWRKTKGMWWRKTVRNTLRRHSKEFKNINGKWYIR